jgi:hypothetical protein
MASSTFSSSSPHGAGSFSLFVLLQIFTMLSILQLASALSLGSLLLQPSAGNPLLHPIVDSGGLRWKGWNPSTAGGGGDGKTGAVASESDICSNIGIELLRRGGNAADAVSLPFHLAVVRAS